MKARRSFRNWVWMSLTIVAKRSVLTMSRTRLAVSSDRLCQRSLSGSGLPA